jgi:hypothetical protein
VLLDFLFIGLAVTLDPIPLTAFLLLLSSKGGVRKGAVFIFGWLASLAVVIAVTITITGNNPPKPDTVPTLAALAVKIAIGVALLIIAIRQRRRLGRPRKPPKWQAGVDNMSLWFALALAPLTQPWGLIAAGVADIVNAKISTPGSYLALIFFCLVASSTILTMEIYAGFWPEPAKDLMTRIRRWIDTHTDQVIIIVFTALGLWLIAKSVYTLLSS